jgi:CRP-like cAMP-binding protein
VRYAGMNLTGFDSRRAVAMLAARLQRRSSLSQHDLAVLDAFDLQIQPLHRGMEVVRQGDKPNKSVFILSGMLARYHQMPEGPRQYLSLHMAGDFPDLQSLLLGEMDHALQSIDESVVALLPHEELKAAFFKAPGLGMAMWRETLLDAAIFRQAIVSNGARSSLERVAHLFCEIYVRSWQAGLAEHRTCEFPLSQMQIAQTLGLSIVTVNRVVQVLRKEKCAEMQGRTLIVLDWARLQERAGFDPAYLQLDLSASTISPPEKRPPIPP